MGHESQQGNMLPSSQDCSSVGHGCAIAPLSCGFSGLGEMLQPAEVVLCITRAAAWFCISMHLGCGAGLCSLPLCEGRLHAFVAIKIGVLLVVTGLFKGRYVELRCTNLLHSTSHFFSYFTSSRFLVSYAPTGTCVGN